MNCKECAKQFTCKEYGKEECRDKIKFSEAGVFEPERIENVWRMDE